MLQRLRDRTLEENVRLESDQDVSQGILLGEVLGVIQDQEVILSPRLGGVRISRQGSSMNANPGFCKNNAPQGKPAEGIIPMVRAAETQDQRRPGALSRTRTETPPWPWTANM